MVIRTGRKFSSKTARASASLAGLRPAIRRQTSHSALVDRPGIARTRFFQKGLAARQERGESGDVIIRGPAIEIGPLHRFELGIGELERIGGRQIGRPGKAERGYGGACERDFCE